MLISRHLRRANQFHATNPLFCADARNIISRLFDFSLSCDKWMRSLGTIAETLLVACFSMRKASKHKPKSETRRKAPTTYWKLPARHKHNKRVNEREGKRRRLSLFNNRISTPSTAFNILLFFLCEFIQFFFPFPPLSRAREGLHRLRCHIPAKIKRRTKRGLNLVKNNFFLPFFSHSFGEQGIFMQNAGFIREFSTRKDTTEEGSLTSLSSVDMKLFFSLFAQQTVWIWFAPDSALHTCDNGREANTRDRKLLSGYLREGSSWLECQQILFFSRLHKGMAASIVLPKNCDPIYRWQKGDNRTTKAGAMLLLISAINWTFLALVSSCSRERSPQLNRIAPEDFCVRHTQKQAMPRWVKTIFLVNILRKLAARIFSA